MHGSGRIRATLAAAAAVGRWLALAIVALAGLSAPAASAPPRNLCSTNELGATLDQYCETLPTATGPRGAGDKDDGRPSLPAPSRPIPGAVVQMLRGSELGRVLVGDPGRRGDSAVQERASTRRRQLAGGARARREHHDRPDAAEPAGGAAMFSAGDAVAGVPAVIAMLALGLLAIGAIVGVVRAARSRSA